MINALEAIVTEIMADEEKAKASGLSKGERASIAIDDSTLHSAMMNFIAYRAITGGLKVDVPDSLKTEKIARSCINQVFSQYKGIANRFNTDHTNLAEHLLPIHKEMQRGNRRAGFNLESYIDRKAAPVYRTLDKKLILREREQIDSVKAELPGIGGLAIALFGLGITSTTDTIFYLPAINETIQTTGHALSWVGTASLVAAGYQYLKNLVGEAKEGGRELMSQGMYKLSRNPLYVTYRILATANVMERPDVDNFLYALGILGLTSFAARTEEKTLPRFFGTSYLRYKKDVSRFLPFKYVKNLVAGA